MNRRSFLGMLGLAPVVAAGAVVAAPKVYASGGMVGPLKGYAYGVGEIGPELRRLKPATATLGFQVNTAAVRAEVDRAVRQAMKPVRSR